MKSPRESVFSGAGKDIKEKRRNPGVLSTQEMR